MDDSTNAGSGPPADGATTPAGPVPGDSHDLTGTVLAGRYRIVGKLGEGAMGAVWLGEHLRIGRRDAIKVLRGGLAEDADSIARFHRGARHLSAIRHTNVCTLYDYGETEDGSPFLALELIEGESLKELVDREGALEPHRAIGIARQIAAALHAAHDAGIVHRDLKPGNVMIERGRDGTDLVKVVDFDIAKGPEGTRGEEVTQLGFVVGTPEYMSPEQLMGDRLDGRSDLYSLGLVLFRMLAGDLPFRGGSTHEVMVQRLTAPPLTVDEVAASAVGVPGLQEVMDRALALELSRRYADAGEFGVDLDRLLAGTAPAAPPPVAPAVAATRPAVPETMVASSATFSPQPSGTIVTGTASTTRRWWMAAAAVVVIGGAGAAALMLSGNGGAPAEQTPSATVESPGDSQAVADPRVAAAVDSPKIGNPGRGRDPESTGRQAAPPGQAGQETTTPPATNPPVPEQPRIVIDAAAARVRLDRLEDLILGGSADAATAGAVRDTASAIYQTPGVTTADKASAAYLVANAYLILEDGAECERWINRVLEIRTDRPPFATQLLTSCRSIRG